MKSMKKVGAICLIGLMFVVFNYPVMAGPSKININTATQKELTSLKYVGDKIAIKMISHRKAEPFKTPQDIMKVKGVGKKVYEANKNIITVKDTKK